MLNRFLANICDQEKAVKLASTMNGFFFKHWFLTFWMKSALLCSAHDHETAIYGAVEGAKDI